MKATYRSQIEFMAGEITRLSVEVEAARKTAQQGQQLGQEEQGG